MKVLHLSNIAGRSGGGVSAVVHALLYYQCKFYLRSTLWFSGKKRQEEEIAKDNSIERDRVHALNVDLRTVFDFFLELRKSSRDNLLIHQHGIFLPISLLTLLAGRSGKVVISPHGYLEPEKLQVSSSKKRVVLALFERSNLKKCDCLIACSKKEAISLRNFGLSQPIAILPNGVDDHMIAKKKSRRKKSLAFRTKYNIGSDAKVLLFLSRIHPFKGLSLLLRCILLIQDRFRGNDWIFVVAGPSELNHEDELKAFVKSNNMDDIVIFTGPQYGQSKVEALDSADCFILPSKGENFGIAVIEALARGLPVITTKHTPWDELEAFNCGWWVSRTESELIDVLAELLAKNKDYLSNMGENGIDLVKDRYTWPNIAQQSVQIYKWVLNNYDKEYQHGFSLLK